MARVPKLKDSKKRLSVPLSSSIYEQLENDAEIMGVSMSTYAALIIGTHYKTQMQSVNAVKETISKQLGPLFSNHNFSNDDINKVFDEAMNETNKLMLLNLNENTDK